MRTMGITEEVSLHPGKNVGCSQRHWNTPGTGEKPRTDWEKNLQIYGIPIKSRKSPTLVVGKKPNEESRT
jgi:hypothetical protein